MKLEVRKLSKSYASGKRVVEALAPTSFDVREGEFVSLIGPEGCGKSTALNLIAGLEAPSGGEILLDGTRVMGPGRERGMVFQNYTLFPWLTVEENARFSFRLSQCAPESGAEDVTRALALLDLMGLKGYYGAYPRELSGCMKQRVAIARALTHRPKVLLMDEPFGALDAAARQEMQELMLLLQAHESTTVMFVTDDVEEALYLSSRVLVLSPGPGTIIRDLVVPFAPAPLRTPELKRSPEFAGLKRELLQLLRPSAQVPLLDGERDLYEYHWQPSN
jgi:ABC-type nitrate/sulfonate/bicarbonate transport system ATPase subunit